MYKNITDENTKNSEKSIIKKAIVKNCGWWKNFDCIFGFSLKSYVRNTINLSCAKILLTSVISSYTHGKETNWAPLLPLDSPDDVGTSCPRDCLIGSDCLIQCEVSRRVRMIHHQLMGPTIASRLKCLTLHHRLLSDRGRHVCTEFLEIFRWPVWQKL